MLEVSEAESTPPARHWTLDRRIPIAVVVTIVIQTASVIWWASSLSGRVTAVEYIQQTQADIPGRVIRLETMQVNVGEQLKTINEKLDRLIERRP